MMLTATCAAIALAWVVIAIMAKTNGLDAAVIGIVFAVLAVAFK